MELDIKYTKEGLEINGTNILLEDIISKCNSARVSDENLALMKISWSGRSGNILESIVRPLEDINRLKELLIGKEVYFGEIWGKHSEVYGEITEGDVIITTNEDTVKSFLRSYPNGHDYDHSFIYNYIEVAADQMDEEEYVEGGHKKDIEEINRILSQK